MQWQSLRFEELSTQTLYELLRLRVDIFVVEQQCPYPELDGKDYHPEVRHLLGYDDAGALVAYARQLPPGLSYPDASIGRVLVNPEFRKQRAGKALMLEAIARCQQYWPQQNIQIGAQLYLADFYQSLGFTPVSNSYLEDGIPHIDMLRLHD
ncbi:GNAT family N-acetyltransferase [Shewanella avicenniae]|uniref:GNAT family N-acetyltransferase n=1 Tax=Shewanella avicenniae TaxID=2814294 RepID=A0ABX7QSQ8_9GAMM|nr:GNAT family N-acetyltransferase [Shewanella avicenniae]QSX34030.1 GNAT family N-acetyltransferase [Shewanella avicenniae]